MLRISVKCLKVKYRVLQHGEKLIADSSHIQRYLKETYGFDLDKYLTTEQKVIAEAFRRMTEEHLYWIGVIIKANLVAYIECFDRAVFRE